MHKLSYIDPAWQAGHPQRHDTQWLRNHGWDDIPWIAHSHPPVFKMQNVAGQAPKI